MNRCAGDELVPDVWAVATPYFSWRIAGDLEAALPSRLGWNCSFTVMDTTPSQEGSLSFGRQGRLLLWLPECQADRQRNLSTPDCLSKSFPFIMVFAKILVNSGFRDKFICPLILKFCTPKHKPLERMQPVFPQDNWVCLSVCVSLELRQLGLADWQF